MILLLEFFDFFGYLSVETYNFLNCAVLVEAALAEKTAASVQTGVEVGDNVGNAPGLFTGTFFGGQFLAVGDEGSGDGFEKQVHIAKVGMFFIAAEEEAQLGGARGDVKKAVE